MTPDSLIAIIFVLVGIISALVAGHYVSVVWEVRKLREDIAEGRKDIAEVRREITTSALAVANAATAAAQTAVTLAAAKKGG